MNDSQNVRIQGGKIYYAVFSAIMFMVFSVFGLFAIVKAFIPPYAMAPIIIFVGIAINQESPSGKGGYTGSVCGLL